ncbi:hypothetical protein MPLA_1800117 [Mesorhizobium sp. ORS 3359]|nr:hypothetical protein MPLA_1800117 [Mesorhizobium sp. ORS 3359]
MATNGVDGTRKQSDIIASAQVFSKRLHPAYRPSAISLLHFLCMHRFRPSGHEFDNQWCTAIPDTAREEPRADD